MYCTVLHVQCLQTKLDENKRKKDEFIRETHEHDEAIQGLRAKVESSISAIASGEALAATMIAKETAKLNSSVIGVSERSFSPFYSPNTHGQDIVQCSTGRASYNPSLTRNSTEGRGVQGTLIREHTYTSTPRSLK